MKCVASFAWWDVKRIPCFVVAFRAHCGLGWFLAGVIMGAGSAAAQVSGTWQNVDVGAVSASGSVSVNGDIITVRGSGEDIWTGVDEFHFRHIMLTGDGEIRARVTSIQNTHTWAKAGIMIRESLGSGARNAFVFVNGASNAGVQYRNATGGGTAVPPWSYQYGSPYWLWLRRQGDQLLLAASADGIGWQTVTLVVSLPATAYIGLAVTSHVDGTLCTTTFDNIVVRTPADDSTTTPTPPSNLTAAAISAREIRLQWNDNSTDETGFDVDRSLDGVNFTNNLRTPANTTSTVQSNLSPSTTYYFRVRAVKNNSFGQVYSNYTPVVSASTPAEQTVSGWQNRDIGFPLAPGRVTVSGTSVTVAGAGDDIWGRADEGHFYFQPLTGDGEIVARLTVVDNTDPSAKAGIMMRARVSPSVAAPSQAPNIFLAASPQFKVTMQRRVAQAGDTSAADPNWMWPPTWMKLVRLGSVYYVYLSTTGTDWALIGSPTLDLGATIDVGLAVTSHRDGTLCNATFDNVRVAAGSTPPPATAPAAPSNVTATALATNSLQVTWTDNSSDETGFHVQESSDGITFGITHTMIANWTSFTDTTLPPSTRRFYRVRSIRGDAFSDWSPIVNATTHAALAAPSELRATPTSPTSMRITWRDNAADDTGFQLQWSQSSTFATIAGETYPDPNVTSLETWAFRGGTTYYFRIRTRRGTDRSAWSETTSATTPASAPVPPGPVDVAAAATSATQIRITWTDNSSSELYYDVQRSSSATDFSSAINVARVAANQTAFIDSGLNPNTTYHYRIQGIYNGYVSQWSASASATTPAASTSADWQGRDVGAPYLAGQSSVLSTSIVSDGAGQDVWGPADQFQYYARTIEGDAEVVVRLNSLSNTHAWAKAGLMIRQNLSAGSANAFLFATPGFVIGFQHRSSASGETILNGTYWRFAPVWLRLVRAGNLISGYYSDDGARWSPAGSVTMAMSSPVLVGLAVTSHDPMQLTRATFDQLNVNGSTATSPRAPAAPSNLVASVEPIDSTSSALQVRLTWTDNSENESVFEIERSTDGTSFSRLGLTRAASALDSSVSSGSTYWYRVRALSGDGPSGYSNQVSVAVTAAPSWTLHPIGSISPGAEVSTAGDSFLIRASGTDIWDTADSFAYLAQVLSGDGEIVARIDSIENTHAWAKAGVMIRESLAADARHVFALVTPSNGVVAHARPNTGSATTITAGPWWAAAPYWVKVSRSGSTFTTSASPDGTTWSVISIETVTMGANVFVGVAVTSHNTAQATSVAASNVEVTRR